MYHTDNYGEDNTQGMVTALAALALALEENGALKSQAYGNALQRLWTAMPEEEAIGESGALIEKLLAALADKRTGQPAGNSNGETTVPEAVILRVA